MRIKAVWLIAVETKKGVSLLDANGDVIRANLPVLRALASAGNIGIADKLKASIRRRRNRLAWSDALAEAITKLQSRVAARSMRGWDYKLENLARVAYRRQTGLGQGYGRKSTNKGFYKYTFSTEDWSSALTRINTTAANRNRRSESIWDSWCHNKVKNQADRVRFMEWRRDNQEESDGDAEAAGLHLPTNRTQADAQERITRPHRPAQ